MASLVCAGAAGSPPVFSVPPPVPHAVSSSAATATATMPRVLCARLIYVTSSCRGRQLAARRGGFYQVVSFPDCTYHAVENAIWDRTRCDNVPARRLAHRYGGTPVTWRQEKSASVSHECLGSRERAAGSGQRAARARGAVAAPEAGQGRTGGGPGPRDGRATAPTDNRLASP